MKGFMWYTEAVLTNLLYFLLGITRLVAALPGESLIAASLSAHVHPRVTEFDGADHKEFDKLEGARNSIGLKGFAEFDEVLKYPTQDTAVPQSRGRYYAVAYGGNTGVFKDWQAVEKVTKGFKSACHQRFDSEREAKEFIQDWKDAYAEDLKFDIASTLIKIDGKVDTDENVLAKLGLL
ncbi:hypothetical protein BDW59DRAFT_165587 [Aspergillus cavernicola]|uniref:Ribonuclease H1 N-terminal domain-containing protein n=1 Tax=Aspergillus cavernicola TaxID=176166 RepID=A0ABR4HRZ0_9EURO